MAYEHKPNTGSIFKNDKKTEERHPDFRGIYKNEQGVEYYVSAWLKNGAKGEFISFTTKKKEV